MSISIGQSKRTSVSKSLFILRKSYEDLLEVAKFSKMFWFNTKIKCIVCMYIRHTCFLWTGKRRLIFASHLDSVTGAPAYRHIFHSLVDVANIKWSIHRLQTLEKQINRPSDVSFVIILKYNLQYALDGGTVVLKTETKYSNFQVGFEPGLISRLEFVLTPLQEFWTRLY